MESPLHILELSHLSLGACQCEYLKYSYWLGRTCLHRPYIKSCCHVTSFNSVSLMMSRIFTLRGEVKASSACTQRWPTSTARGQSHRCLSFLLFFQTQGRQSYSHHRLRLFLFPIICFWHLLPNATAHKKQHASSSSQHVVCACQVASSIYDPVNISSDNSQIWRCKHANVQIF